MSQNVLIKPTANISFFNTNFYLIVINTLLVCFLAAVEDWNGSDAIQVLIIGTFSSLPFTALIFICNPSKSLFTQLINITFILLFVTPLISVLIFFFNQIIDIDLVSAMPDAYLELSPLKQLVISFYTLPFIYLKYLLSLHTIPAIAIFIQYSNRFLWDYFTQRSHLFSITHPLGIKFLQFRFLLPFFAIMTYFYFDIQNSLQLNSFIVWFFIAAYFLLELGLHYKEQGANIAP